MGPGVSYLLPPESAPAPGVSAPKPERLITDLGLSVPGFPPSEGPPQGPLTPPFKLLLPALSPLLSLPSQYRAVMFTCLCPPMALSKPSQQSPKGSSAQPYLSILAKSALTLECHFA